MANMANLYADEQFPRPVVEFLRNFGHNVLTTQEAGQANQGIPDEEVLLYAINCDRAVITQNRYDFRRLHRLNPDHAGIIVCSRDLNWERLATRTHQAICNLESLKGQLITVNRPQI